MEAFSTVNVLMNLYTTVYDLYEEMRTIELVKAAIPYPLVEERLDVPFPSLPPGFKEYNYFIPDGSSRRAEVSFAFKDCRFVNFNVQVYPKELFKKRAIKRALKHRFFPYVSAKAQSRWETTEMGLVARDHNRELVHNVRMKLSAQVTISASMMAAEFAGM